MHGLVVAAAVRVVDRVHRHSADSWVEFAARLGTVVGGTGLHQRLLAPAVAGQHADGSAAFRWQVLDATAR